MTSRGIRRSVVACGLFFILLFATCQQVMADPSIYFFGGYTFVSGQQAVNLTFQVEGVLPSDQIHAMVSISKSSPAPYWIDRQDYFYNGPGIFSVLIHSKDGYFQHGATYYVTLYVTVTIVAMPSRSFVQYANYNIDA